MVRRSVHGKNRSGSDREKEAPAGAVSGGSLRSDLKSFTRQRILDAALECFRQTSFRATTVEQIVARAGMTVPTFYRYFPSKDDLLVPLRDHLHSEVVGVLRELDKVDVTSKLALRQWFDGYVVMWSRVHRLCDAFWEGSTLDGAGADEIFSDTIDAVSVLDRVLQRHDSDREGLIARLALLSLFMDRAALLIVAARSAAEANRVRDEFTAILWSVLNNAPGLSEDDLPFQK